MELADRKQVEWAIQFATQAHAGQPDRSDLPYILHPIGVARRVALRGGRPHVVVAAVLHDVVEDCDVPIEEVLRKFGAEVAYVVQCVTHVDGESYDEYMEHVIEGGPDPMLLKYCDFEDNLEPMRQGRLTQAEALRYRLKYGGHKAHLGDLLGIE